MLLLLVGALSAAACAKLLPVAAELLGGVLVRQLPLERHVGHGLVHEALGLFALALVLRCSIQALFVVPVQLGRVGRVPQYLVGLLLGNGRVLPAVCQHCAHLMRRCRLVQRFKLLSRRKGCSGFVFICSKLISEIHGTLSFVSSFGSL